MLLDISESSYIFRQEILIGKLEIAFFFVLVIFLLLRLAKRINKATSKLQEIGKTILMIFLSLFVYFYFLFPIWSKTLNLEKSGIETSGLTIKWIDIENTRRIEYSYNLNGKTYIKQCDVVYRGHEIDGIVCPKGKYVVIYDKEDPENSVMDLKRQVK